VAVFGAPSNCELSSHRGSAHSVGIKRSSTKRYDVFLFALQAWRPVSFRNFFSKEKSQWTREKQTHSSLNQVAPQPLAPSVVRYILLHAMGTKSRPRVCTVFTTGNIGHEIAVNLGNKPQTVLPLIIRALLLNSLTIG